MAINAIAAMTISFVKNALMVWDDNSFIGEFIVVEKKGETQWWKVIVLGGGYPDARLDSPGIVLARPGPGYGRGILERLTL